MIQTRPLKVWFLLLAAAIVALAAMLRFPGLDLRPLHGDEGLNTIKFLHLWRGEGYQYDPTEYHGPTLPYLTLPAVALSGADNFAGTDEATYRIVTAVFGLGVVLLTFMFRRFIGDAATLTAALLIAISPAMVFYSRYYIHETPLVFFTAAALYALLHVIADERRRVLWCALLGGSFALMHATKETGVISGLAMLIALPASGLLRVASLRTLLRPAHVAAFAAAFVSVDVLLFSSFFTHPRGIVDSVLTYWHYLHRGSGGEPLHVQAWHYYLTLLTYRYAMGVTFAEALVVLLGVMGMLLAFLPRLTTPLLRFLALYVFISFLIYSLIPYKTPWSILAPYHGLCLLAGVGFAALLHAGAALTAVPRLLVAAALSLAFLIAAAHLLQQSYRANFVLHTDRRNPWVYAHPTNDMREKMRRLDDIASFKPEVRRSPVRVVSSTNYWPLPFYLRSFPRVLYAAGELSDAAIVIAGPDDAAGVAEKLGEGYAAHLFGLRPGVLFTIFVRSDVWNAYLNRPTPAAPSP